MTLVVDMDVLLHLAQSFWILPSDILTGSLQFSSENQVDNDILIQYYDKDSA